MTAPCEQAHRSESRRIGGPDTRLPRPVESFLSWILAIACLTVSGYHYIAETYLTPTFQRLFSRESDADAINALPCWLPLTTMSRSEMDRMTPMQRHDQLLKFLQKITKKERWTDEELATVLRNNDGGRRLASLAMRPIVGESPAQTALGQQLVKIWPVLLALPSLVNVSMFDISLIVPAYRERGTDVRKKLTRALQTCQNPAKIEVIVINAGGCDGLEEEVGSLQGWGDLRFVEFTNGGGRGPCLNFGAKEATGRLYTFCHSDTTLPVSWDLKIISNLDEHHLDGRVRANSCAFSFGIDTSEAGLDGGPYPPGMKAVETTANMRTHLYSLPYGDQVLSVPAVIFCYIGGFPDQCLMEDYELVSLLRRRAALLHKFSIPDEERLIIIPGPPALCSPRRWQKFGVLYVTYMNSKFVNLYASGLTPDDIFALYYKRPPPERSSKLAPWENEPNMRYLK